MGLEAADEIGGHFLRADLSDMTATRQLAEQALDMEGRVDILVNNAGYQNIHPVEEFPDETWAEMVQVMLVAPFQLTKYLVPAMKAQGWGRIINMASIHGLVASRYKSAYNSAKHGLVGLTKTVALEVGEFGITVNANLPRLRAHAPGRGATGRTRQRTRGLSVEEVVEKVMLEPAAIKRLIDPDEVAALAAVPRVRRRTVNYRLGLLHRRRLGPRAKLGCPQRPFRTQPQSANVRRKIALRTP